MKYYIAFVNLGFEAIKFFFIYWPADTVALYAFRSISRYRTDNNIPYLQDYGTVSLIIMLGVLVNDASQEILRHSLYVNLNDNSIAIPILDGTSFAASNVAALLVARYFFYDAPSRTLTIDVALISGISLLNYALDATIINYIICKSSLSCPTIKADPNDDDVINTVYSNTGWNIDWDAGFNASLAEPLYLI